MNHEEGQPLHNAVVDHKHLKHLCILLLFFFFYFCIFLRVDSMHTSGKSFSWCWIKKHPLTVTKELKQHTAIKAPVSDFFSFFFLTSFTFWPHWVFVRILFIILFVFIYLLIILLFPSLSNLFLDCQLSLRICELVIFWMTHHRLCTISKLVLWKRYHLSSILHLYTIMIFSSMWILYHCRQPL